MAEHVIDPPRLTNAATFPAPEAVNRQSIVAPLLANVSLMRAPSIIENRKRSGTGIAPSRLAPPPPQGRAPTQREPMAKILNTLIGPYRI